MERIFFWGILGWLAMAGPSWAAVNDAPHNENIGITCVNCHSYSLWWRFSPASAQEASTFGTIANDLCLHCHNDPNGPAPYKKGHSGASFETAAQHGDWSTNCIDCHDPHLQPQLQWRNTDTPNTLYLVTGTIGNAASFDLHPDGTTTFNYTVPGSGDPTWADPATWINKNASSRSLIFVDDTLQTDHTFLITAADAETITVKGLFPDTAAGHSFGLIYGQLIKSPINTPRSGARPVKFFDPKKTFTLGGFTDPNIAGETDPAIFSQGVCQVCHTSTKYWRNDGNADRATGKLHNETIVCTACHTAQSGFKPSGGPHLFLGETTYCVTCHQSGNILGVHNNNCQNCHTTPPTLADPATKPLVVQIVRGTCQDCHGLSAHVSATAHNHRQVTTGCLPCHLPDTAAKVDTIHKQDCNTCHGYSGTKLDATVVANAILTGKSVNGTDVNCQTCHTTGHLAVTWIPFLPELHALPLSNSYCTDCHANGLPAHNNLTAVASCAVAGCHPLVDSQSTPKSIFAIHLDNCLKCHQSSRPEVSAAITAGRTDQGTETNCNPCHDAHYQSYPH